VWGVGADFRVVAFRVIFLHDEGAKWGGGCFLCFGLVDMDFRQKCSIFWRRMKKGWGSFSWGSWCDESGISFEFLYYK
ncbi:MAG: hypothetical protein MR795_08210, partial [Bacteroidales bacterium]|nr:hypothetical protein [Bacteroidales bacterium]